MTSITQDESAATGAPEVTVDTRRPGVADALAHRNALMVWAHAQAPSEVNGRATTGPATRDAVLEAAIELFAQRGFRASTMKDLAGAGNVKAPALYNHFGSKEEILAEAMRRAMSIFVLNVVGPAEAEPVEKWLGRLVLAHTMQHLTNPKLQNAKDMVLQSETLSRHLPREDYESIIWSQREYVNLIRALIDVATEGQISHAERTVAAFSLVAMCDRVSSWFRPEGTQTADEVSAIIWDLVTAMLRLNAPRVSQSNR